MKCKNCHSEILQPKHFCPFCGIFLEHGEEIPLDELSLTILRADLAGFTLMSESALAEDMMAFLNDIFSVFSRILESYKGVIYQVIGDEIVAVFGFPKSLNFAPHMAIIAAEDMLKALTVINKKGYFQKSIGLKIGIAMDHALIFSLSDSLHNAVIITPGFLKSQVLQKNAENNTILIDENLYNATKAFFTFNEIGDFVKNVLTIKGFEYRIKEK